MKKNLPFLEETRQQGYAAFPCSMYRADSSAEMTGIPFITKPHWHSSIEILHFEKGSFQLMVNMENYEISEECYALIDHGMIHAISSEENYRESALLFSPIVLSTRNIDTAEQKLISPLMSGSLALPRLITKDMDIFPLFDQSYRQIFQIFMNANDRRADQFNISKATDQLRVKALMMLLISDLSDAKLLAFAPSTPDPKAEALKKVLTYIGTHYHEKIYLKDLAKLMNLNEQYFSRFFKKALGKTPFEYINEVRIRKAVESLEHTNDSILEVALSSGFGNMGHFIEIFKRSTGMRPLEFRNQSRRTYKTATNNN